MQRNNKINWIFSVTNFSWPFSWSIRQNLYAIRRTFPRKFEASFKRKINVERGSSIISCRIFILDIFNNQLADFKVPILGSHVERSCAIIACRIFFFDLLNYEDANFEELLYLSKQKSIIKAKERTYQMIR